MLQWSSSQLRTSDTLTKQPLQQTSSRSVQYHSPDTFTGTSSPRLTFSRNRHNRDATWIQVLAIASASIALWTFSPGSFKDKLEFWTTWGGPRNYNCPEIQKKHNPKSCFLD